MQRLPTLLFLATAAIVQRGGFAYIHRNNVELTPQSPVLSYSRAYMYSLSDDVGEEQPFVSLKATQTSASGSSNFPPEYHVVFASVWNNNALGMRQGEDSPVKVCCASEVDRQTYDCRIGSVLIDYNQVEDGATGPIVYSFKDQTSFFARENITTSGHVYLYLIACPSHDNSTWTSSSLQTEATYFYPYGYVPAEYMGALGLYGVYSIMCGLLLLGYIGMMVKHRRYILLLQYCTLGVIIVALAESVGYYFTYSSKNETGVPPCCPYSADVVVISILNGLKRTLLRMLLLAVALGFGVVERRLNRRNTCVLLGLGVLYFIAAVFSELLRFSSALTENDVNLWMLPEVALNVMFVLLIIQEFVRIREYLGREGETVKKSMYDRLWQTLKFTGVVFLVFALLEFLVQAHILPLVPDPEFISVVGWSLLYYVVMLEIAFIWAPGRSSYEMSWYSQPLQEDSDVESGSDGSGSAPPAGQQPPSQGGNADDEGIELTSTQPGTTDNGQFTIGEDSSEEEEDAGAAAAEERRAPIPV